MWQLNVHSTSLPCPPEKSGIKFMLQFYSIQVHQHKHWVKLLIQFNSCLFNVKSTNLLLHLVLFQFFCDLQVDYAFLFEQLLHLLFFFTIAAVELLLLAIQLQYRYCVSRAYGVERHECFISSEIIRL